ncbi:UDP-glucose 4-epimerase GalE [Lentibacillus sp. JNUCC-1]|uniref:UDP-glucose 4-epimerase GalE n=1 Tax=Lentibacillus sp. JNUCC-1 TaxID=2654513 RepID=UPI002F9082C3
MAVLVTGGAGYIGSHACVELLLSGRDVVVLDNFSNSSPVALKRIKDLTGKSFRVYNVDLLDKAGLEHVFSENDIEAVLHFAGLKAVGESVSVPLKYYRNNVIGTVYLCEVMQQYGVKRMVFSSSATVYGVAENVPITEDSRLTAINPYGRTKLMIEELLHDIYQADDEWRIAVLRYFNPVGAHSSGKIGEDPKGTPNNLMPYIAQVAAGKRPQLSVFGANYPTKDGTGIRDYIHVVDLALAHLKALEYIQAHAGIEAFNIGTGVGYSVLEMINAFEQASGKTIPYIVSERRNGDVALCYANPDKARSRLKWQAKRDIHAMCEDTWRWQSNNPNGYQSVSDSRQAPIEKESPLVKTAAFLL